MRFQSFIKQTFFWIAGKSFEEAKQKLKKDYLRGMKANYTVWPAVNFINFKYVPLEQRILFSAGT